MSWYITVLMSFDMPHTLFTDNGLWRIFHQKNSKHNSNGLSLYKHTHSDIITV